MPRLTRRSRIISVRLSSEEYEQVQRHCAAQGIDSVSEMARKGLKYLLAHENGSGHGPLEKRVEDMGERMAALDREMRRLLGLLGIACQEERSG